MSFHSIGVMRNHAPDFTHRALTLSGVFGLIYSAFHGIGFSCKNTHFDFWAPAGRGSEMLRRLCFSWWSDIGVLAHWEMIFRIISVCLAFYILPETEIKKKACYFFHLCIEKIFSKKVKWLIHQYYTQSTMLYFCLQEKFDSWIISVNIFVQLVLFWISV